VCSFRVAQTLTPGLMACPWSPLASLSCLRQLAQQQAVAMLTHGETVEEQLLIQMDAETDDAVRADLGYAPHPAHAPYARRARI
jgi:hypothetical protein